MTTKEVKTENSTVKELRDIRDKIGVEIKDMTYEELKKYVEEKLTLHPTAVWR